MNMLRLRHEFEETLGTYQASQRSRTILQKSQIALFDGPSASGRNTIIAELIATGKYHQMVSDTTRLPRVNNGVQEQDGVEYWFKSEEAFLAGLKKGAYVEAAIIHNQQVSGVSVAEIERADTEGKVAINDIQSDGIEAFRQYNPNISCFFIVPPDFPTWQARLRARGEMSEEEYERRLTSAIHEIQRALDSEYYYFVVNDNLTAAVQLVDGVCRSERTPGKGVSARQTAQNLLSDIKKALS